MRDAGHASQRLPTEHNPNSEFVHACVAQVPFVDVLNTMSDVSLPLTPMEWPEWGNPLTSQEAYDYIASYSPYDNIRDAAYPTTLILGGLTDSRVTYWEPAKMAARMRDHNTGPNRILLKARCSVPLYVFMYSIHFILHFIHPRCPRCR